MDYVPLVHRLLTEKVETIVQSYVRRKEYVAALLSVIGRSVLEYDTESRWPSCSSSKASPLWLTVS